MNTENKIVTEFNTYLRAERDGVLLYFPTSEKSEAYAYNNGAATMVQGFAVFDKRFPSAAFALFSTKDEADDYVLPLDSDEEAVLIPEIPIPMDEEPEDGDGEFEDSPPPEPKFRGRRPRDSKDD